MKQLVLILLVGLVLPIFGAELSSDESGIRTKRVRRGFFWPFSGNSDAVETQTANNPTAVSKIAAYGDLIPQQYILPQQIHVPTQLNQQLSGLPYNAPPSAAILNHGNLHYPIYRVHKYNGVHLKPIPVSLVGHVDNNGIIAAPEQSHSAAVEENEIEKENDEKHKNTNADGEPPKMDNTPLQITPELINLARRLGIKDISKLPSLDDAMILLGTTTQAETIMAIQELAATEDGLNLIKQYLNGQDDSEEVSSETVEQYALPQEHGEPLVPEQSISVSSVLPAASVNPYGPLHAVDATLDRTRTSLEIVKGFLPTPAPKAGFFSRIATWSKILNPLAGREEIPIPAFGEGDVDGINQSGNVASGVNTLPIPTLPELAQLPVIAGLESQSLQVPALPQIHIPQGYIIPHHLQKTIGGGPYIRVKLPLSGFNPTPEIPIDAQYINHYQRHVLAPNNQLVAPNSQLVAPNSQLVAPSAQQPIVFHARQTPIATNTHTSSLPVVDVRQATPSFTKVSQIPLADVNYEIFKNAPRIVTSYGTPALPYTYPEDNPGASFSSSTAIVTPHIDLKVSASEPQKRSVAVPNSSSIEMAEAATLDTLLEDMATSDEATKSTQVAGNSAPVESVTTDAIPKSTENMTSQTTIQRRSGTIDSETNVNFIVKPQRISAYDSYATGKLHTADPDAINMFPLTVQHALLNKENGDK